jgi:hypothetical protein
MGELVESKQLNNYQVLTDTGYEDVKAIHKTIPYKIYTICTKEFRLECSFNHILYDENMEEVFASEILIGELIKTENGFQEILTISINENMENMYDLELYDGNRRYYTDGILSHNTNAGKSSAMCALSSNFIRNGYSVLYITLEMAEEKIAQRVDANQLGIDINDIPLMKEKTFKSRLNKIKEKINGRLVIKEFPPAAIGTNRIRALLSELKIKLDFEPQIICLDYLNLMVSDRVKSDNSYTIIKSIAEELRGLAVEGKYAIMTATQGNRDTNSENNSDMDLTNVSESIGLPATVDFMIAAISPAELREQNIQLWKVLKNRFGGIVNHKFPLQVNFARAGLYDMDASTVNISDNVASNGFKMKEEEDRLKKKNEIIVEEDEEIGDMLDLINE